MARTWGGKYLELKKNRKRLLDYLKSGEEIDFDSRAEIWREIIRIEGYIKQIGDFPLDQMSEVCDDYKIIKPSKINLNGKKWNLLPKGNRKPRKKNKVGSRRSIRDLPESFIDEVGRKRDQAQ